MTAEKHNNFKHSNFNIGMRMNLIALVVLLGITSLFFFPNPEENFILYAGIALFFVILTIFLIIKNKKHKRK